MATDVKNAIDESVQKDRLEEEFGNLGLVRWISRAGYYVPPWWSFARDRSLRKFWKKSDHLSSAIYTMQSKMVSIPFRVVARNTANRSHVMDAEKWQEILEDGPQFGAGWDTFYKLWLEDYLTQDNGGFAEVIGLGPKTGPLTGRPLSISHLDANLCQRTGNPEYPIIYNARSGKKFKMHYTRVLQASQMTSPIEDMYNVGFCAVSRSINIAQNMIDIVRYKQEKLGSRPHRAILITKGGLDPEDVANAFSAAEASMDSQGLSRYSKVVVAGSSTMKDAGLEKHELSSLPEGFDEETSIVLGMATIALAFGVDARELFPAISSSASKADALLQHMKQRRKGPGEIMNTISRRLNMKFLPPHVKMEFDYQDDAQDRQQAEIEKLRADKRVQDASTKIINTHVSRAIMLDRGEITRNQFAKLELEDGRLMDGSSVLTLFWKDEPLINEYLDLGTDDPLNTAENDKETMKIVIREKGTEIARAISGEKNDEDKIIMKQALAALEKLEDFYDNPQSVIGALTGKSKFEEEQNAQFVDGRVRTDSPLSEEPPEEGNQGNRERNPDTDRAFG